MSNSRLTEAQRRFIDELAALLSSWSMPNNAARLYGYLQIQDGGIGLDEIARDLEMSRSNAWAAARALEHTADVRRMTERGSKRIFYRAGDDPGAPLRRQAETLGRMSRLIDDCKDVVASGPASSRMGRLASFHSDLQEAMQGVIGPVSNRAA